MKNLSRDFKERLEAQGIEPDDVVEFGSRYIKKIDKIFTIVTTTDGKTHKMTSDTPWYAARKNKRW